MKELIISIYKLFKEAYPEEDIIGDNWALAGKLLAEGKTADDVKFNLGNDWDNYIADLELRTLLVAAELDDEDIVFGNGSWIYDYWDWFND